MGRSDRHKSRRRGEGCWIGTWQPPAPDGRRARSIYAACVSQSLPASWPRSPRGVRELSEKDDGAAPTNRTTTASHGPPARPGVVSGHGAFLERTKQRPRELATLAEPMSNTYGSENTHTHSSFVSVSLSHEANEIIWREKNNKQA
jgi:hypothetical protein